MTITLTSISSVNTATARARAADYSFENDREREATVYRARSGSFFVLYATHLNPDDLEDVRIKAEALSRAELERLMEHQAMTVFDENALEVPAEEDAKEETIYLRVTTSALGDAVPRCVAA